jgi:diguanylate cyclase
MARQDSLTGLWNKKTITELLGEELSRSRRDAKPVSSILIDIDKFKEINDTYGHHVGDEVLIGVTSRLKNQIRKHDHIGRYGGDEIMIILWNAGFSNLGDLVQRFNQSVWNQKFRTDAGLLRLSISIGATSTEHHPQISAVDLIKISDSALYKAKRRGRNCSEVLKPSHPKGGKKQYVRKPKK